MRSIVIDIDGVLAEFSHRLHRHLRIHGAEMRPFETPAGPTLWEWEQAYGATPEQQALAWADIYANPEWWSGLPKHADLDPAAIWLLQQLHEQAEVYAVTARPHGSRKVTEQWLKGLGLDIPVVIAPKGKYRALQAMHPLVVIEDKPETLVELATAQRLRAEHDRALLLLVDRPYNQHLDNPCMVRVDSTRAALNRCMQEVLREQQQDRQSRISSGLASGAVPAGAGM